ncbi:serine/threonine kinase [Aureococcus anophagefferens]|nr:serine/threonine kinase [Aureococcus anophagefferens]
MHDAARRRARSRPHVRRVLGREGGRRRRGVVGHEAVLAGGARRRVLGLEARHRGDLLLTGYAVGGDVVVSAVAEPPPRATRRRAGSAGAAPGPCGDHRAPPELAQPGVPLALATNDRVVGAKRTLIVPICYSDDGDDCGDRGANAFAAQLDAVAAAMAAHYAAASFGRLAMVVDVAPVTRAYDFPGRRAPTTAPWASGRRREPQPDANLPTQAASRLEAEGAVDAWAYDFVVAWYPDICWGWAGVAYLPGTDAAVSGFGDLDWDLLVGMHEQGHNFGLGHASTVEDGSRGGAPYADGAAWSEYGSPYDPMGNGMAWGLGDAFTVSGRLLMDWAPADRVPYRAARAACVVSVGEVLLGRSWMPNTILTDAARDDASAWHLLEAGATVVVDAAAAGADARPVSVALALVGGAPVVTVSTDDARDGRAARSACATLAYANQGCGAQGANLGTTFADANECALAARDVSACGNYVMWSVEYNAHWGCRCCAPGGELGGGANDLWDPFSIQYQVKGTEDWIDDGVRVVEPEYDGTFYDILAPQHVPATPRPRYELIKPIGKGKFAVVYRARRIADDELVALKKIAVDSMDHRAREKCLKEVRLLQSLHHPNIIRYLDSLIEGDELVIVFEWAAAGDLKRQIRKAVERKQGFEERVIWKYFSQICDALAHMHEQRILHRDLKPANVFLTLNGTVKVGDLGLAA